MEGAIVVEGKKGHYSHQSTSFIQLVLQSHFVYVKCSRDLAFNPHLFFKRKHFG